MNKSIFFLLFLSSLLINCQNKTINNDIEIRNRIEENKETVYEEVKFEIKSQVNTEGIQVYELHRYKFILYPDSEKSEIVLNGKYYPINLNFTYDTDSEESLNNIRIFKSCKGNEIIFIPTFGSNDEVTYQLLLLKNNLLYENTIHYSAIATTDPKKIYISDKNSIFHINIRNNNLKTKFKKQLSDSSRKK